MVWHNEISGTFVYYRKVFLYGRYRRLTSSRVRATALGAAQRRAVIGRTVVQRRLGAASRTRLAGLIFIGGCAWTLGSLSARVRAPGRSAVRR